MTCDLGSGASMPGKPSQSGENWDGWLPLTLEGGSAGVFLCPQPGPRASSQMLVVFKSAPILKRALKVKQAMMQLYVLKLLKVQTKYLGRQWRKSNMKTMSAIYQKVRHRLNDDWAYGNGKALAQAGLGQGGGGGG